MLLRIVLILCILSIATLCLGYFAGVRVFVVQPIGAVPDGVTLIVRGAPGLRPIDSPDAMCVREQGYVNLLCRGAVLGAVAERGNIMMRLPYSQWLYDLTGAPDVDR